MTKVFHYHAETGEYMGQGQCGNRDSNGNPMLPANATLLKPPKTTKNHVAVFDAKAGEWAVVQDYRGKVYWFKNEPETPHIIQELGEIVPKGAVTKQPPPTPEMLAASADAKRKGLLAASDWRVVRAAEAGEPLAQQWKDYRQALRDLPVQPGYPKTIDWPEEPK